MKKIILTCMLLFLVTGCSVEYNLDIDKDFNFKENMVLSTSKENFEISYDSVDNGIEEIYDNINDSLKFSLYDYDLNKHFKKNVEVVFENKYKDDSELLSSPFLTNVNGRITTYDSEKGNKVFQVMIDYDFFELLKTKTYSSIPVETVKVNIKFPYKIISSNADNVEDNILSWDLKTLVKKRTFYVEYDENELYEQKQSYLGYIIGALALIGVILIFVFKKKNNDKF